MSKHDRSHATGRPSRREFLKTSSAVAAGAMAATLSIERSAHAGADDTLKVGLIGCGGRGTGAAVNALNADPGARITALSDAFADRLDGCLARLQQVGKERVTVDDDHKFVGFDGYKALIDSVDVVLLCTPPHFRPLQLKAAIDAGKHVFCEKPVAVDAPGVRSILATTEEAKKKGLNLVSGLCYRYLPACTETIGRIRDGAIGRVVNIQTVYNTGTLWHRGHEPDWTEMQFQMRNWYYFTWLSGDHNVEQHVHSLDKAVWVMGDQVPERAWGLGGRQVRTEGKFGNIYDHHAVVYEYPTGERIFSYCRQIGGAYRDVSDTVFGTKGQAVILPKYSISGETEWSYRERDKSMYDLEHEALFAAIRKGEAINNGVYMAQSTMMAVVGRMVNYTGQAITWEQAMASEEDLSPESYAWDAKPPILPDENGNYPIAMPGVTKFV